MRFEILHDPSETPNKCTIAPLAGRKDFKIISTEGTGSLGPLSSLILLHHEGECLTEIRREHDLNLKSPDLSLAAVDCLWRRLEGILKRVQAPLPRLARIPEGFVTAYPRVSKKTIDPSGGLATIEALFIASALLGNWDASLLSQYYFGRSFVELNRARFLELGILEADQTQLLPILTAKVRNAQQRRIGRSRI